MLTIGLKNVKFRAYHGVHESEQIVGGYFILNLSVEYNAEKKELLNLGDTVNYEILYRMSKDLMKKPVALLEQVVMELAGKIFASFNNVNRVYIQLEKCNPPIEQLNGSVFVKYDITRDAFLHKG